MNLGTKEIVKKKLLDLQENVRDFQMHSKRIENGEVADIFKEFAEDEAIKARELQKLLDKIE